MGVVCLVPGPFLGVCLVLGPFLRGGVGMPGPRFLLAWVCLIPGPFLGWVCLVHLSAGTSPGRYTPLEGTPPGMCTTSPGKYTPGRYFPRHWHLVVATKAGGKHPTGMHTCLIYHHFAKEYFSLRNLLILLVSFSNCWLTKRERVTLSLGFELLACFGRVGNINWRASN